MATDPALPGHLRAAAARVRAVAVPLTEASVSVSMGRVSVMWDWQGTAAERDGQQAQHVMTRIQQANQALERLSARLDTSASAAEAQLAEEAAAARAAAEKAAAAKAAAAKAAATKAP